MDKNKIKSFAIWARRSLIASVSEKANNIGIYEKEIKDAKSVQGGFIVEGTDSIVPVSIENRIALVKQVEEKGFEQVMEEVAYTWFNRFMGLRYMEVNDYLPSGIRILSSETEGKKEPDVLSRVSEIIEELELSNKAEEIYELLDSGVTSDREKAYRIILVKQCNELGKILPQMFEKISDYTELLLPANLLEEGSVIRKMVEDIQEDDWKQEVEIIGWMYQYYISEKKDEVFAALKKNVKITKENIPAATQLFTPKWIVKYMVENSLGRLWLEGHPNPELQAEFKYYLEEAEQEPEVQVELQKIRDEHAKLTPEDIKVLDPCMGSGHILVYAFDVLYEIYKVAGYSEREIPKLILKNNIYGLDIDDRAAQLASFALIMKARHYNRRLFREIERENLDLNICSIQESNSISKEAIEYFCSLNTGLNNAELKADLEYLTGVFTDAKEYGSILEVEKVNFENLKQRLEEIKEDDNLMFGDYRKVLLEKLPTLIKQGMIMSDKYEVCVTNPPYLGRKGMNKLLIEYLDRIYPKSKNDLYSVFIDKCRRMTDKNKFLSMITQQSWMFLSSFEKLRLYLLDSITITSMLHLGARAFEEINGEVVQSTTFTLRKSNNSKYKATYVKLNAVMNSKKKENEFFNEKNIFHTNSNLYKKLPSSSIAYWISEKMEEIFEKNEKLENKADIKQGMATCNNDRFLRLWFEVIANKCKYNSLNSEDAENSMKKWFPYLKGGTFRKWYGNYEYVVNWYNNGKEIKKFTEELNKEKPGGRIKNQEYYFREGLTWSAMSSGVISFRIVKKGFLFDTKGSVCFPKNSTDNEMILGMLNSKVISRQLEFLAPTLDFNPFAIKNLAVKMLNVNSEEVKGNIKNLICLSKKEWDSFETSWDFKKHPLLLNCSNKFISESFNSLENDWNNNFNQLKANEEELNRIFIDIYGLSDELTPEVEDKDVTIRKADREREVRSFISYGVGCMMGRYSLDAGGLIYAGGDFADKWNLVDKMVRKIEKDDEGNIISDSWVDSKFMPDADNIIPITEDEYFEDDIVARFIEFVKTVYGEDTLEENLDYIADSIDRKASETSRQAIRRYFIKDFYKDHLKVYQKRPIYWMFESGKNNGFKCLVYMHRYKAQTVAKVRTDYIHTLQRKYESEITRLTLVVDSEEYSAKDRAAAKKKIDKISKQIEECREYDQVVAYLANEQIGIDLDDGVKVNYAKFQDVELINSKDKKVKMNLLSKI